MLVFGVGLSFRPSFRVRITVKFRSRAGARFRIMDNIRASVKARDSVRGQVRTRIRVRGGTGFKAKVSSRLGSRLDLALWLEVDLGLG